MAVPHHSARIFLDLYKAGPELRSTLKTLIQFYPLEINKPLDAGGNTLLHYACSYKDHDMFYFLLEQGANPTIRNYGHILPMKLV